MHQYEMRYNVHHSMFSHYFNTPEEVVRFVEGIPEGEEFWIAEGYADYYDHPHGTEIVRRVIGPVRLTHLQFLVARNEVQQMLRSM